MNAHHPVFPGRRLVFVGALALLLTLLNALKPLEIDDTAYVYYARQIARNPLDPYGFEVFWYEVPEPAQHVLVPPLLPYWLAPAVALAGDAPVVWKLWLLPFALLLVGALAALLRRFARGLEEPLLVLAALSPAFLPGFNLMLDLPALGLSLTAVVLFLGACDRGSVRGAVLAGLVAGLAAQTKYTGLLTPAVMLLAGGVFRRPWLGLVAALTAGGVFAAWEAVVAHGYGESHFLFHLRDHDDTDVGKEALLQPLLTILGGIASAQTLLHLAALGRSGRAVLSAGVLAALAYLVLALSPLPLASATWQLLPGEPVTLNFLLFGGLGLLFWGTTALVAWRLGRRRRRVEWFLILWLLLEIAGYFALTPFPAVRRLLGVVTVTLLLGGRLASRTCRAPARRRLVAGAALASAGLGLGFYTVGLYDAAASRRAAEESVALAQGAGTVWFSGHWGFQYYAEGAGGVAVVPGRSRLSGGDWLLVPSWRVVQQRLAVDTTATEPVATLHVTDAVPLTTTWAYFGGYTPLRRLAEPRASVALYRVTADHVCPWEADPEPSP